MGCWNFQLARWALGNFWCAACTVTLNNNKPQLNELRNGSPWAPCATQAKESRRNNNNTCSNNNNNNNNNNDDDAGTGPLLLYYYDMRKLALTAWQGQVD